jgi:hypothetical protein
LLRLLLESDDYVSWIASHLELDWLQHPLVREIAANRFAAESSDSWTGLAPWLSQVENSEWQNLVTEALSDKRSIRDPETLLKGSPARDGTVKNLRNRYIERQMAALSIRLHSPDLKEDEKIQISNQKERLRELKKQPLAAKTQEAEAQPPVNRPS